MKFTASAFVFIIVTVLANGNSYKFVKVENFSSSNESVFKINSLEISSTRLNFTYDILQPFTKIFVSPIDHCNEPSWNKICFPGAREVFHPKRLRIPSDIQGTSDRLVRNNVRQRQAHQWNLERVDRSSERKESQCLPAMPLPRSLWNYQRFSQQELPVNLPTRCIARRLKYHRWANENSNNNVNHPWNYKLTVKKRDFCLSQFIYPLSFWELVFRFILEPDVEGVDADVDVNIDDDVDKNRNDILQFPCCHLW